MNVFKNKKGIVTHPVGLFVFGVILGLVLAWVWINHVSIANPYC